MKHSEMEVEIKNFFNWLTRRFDNIELAGRGQGKGNRPGSGPIGKCICPQCGYSTKHKLGQRCMDRKCPKCGIFLIKA